MSIQFVIGRAGSGKTKWCLDRIVANLKAQPLGPPIYWLLPMQATFQAQRDLACAHGLGGYFRARILSFEDLGREIMEECGGSATPEITNLGRRMILGHLLRQLQPKLKFFQQVAHQPGVAVELDSTFSELERCGHDDVAKLCMQLATDAGSPSLAAKLHDLEIIYSAYSRFLGQDRLDPQRRLNEALGSIAKCNLLRDADIYVDSFYDFTEYERQVLAGLGKHCRSVSITIMMDPESACIADPKQIPTEMNLFHRTEQTYRRLRHTLEQQNVPQVALVILNPVRRFKSRALTALEQWNVASASSSAGLEFIESPDRRSEVDAVARRIGDLAAVGMRYRDIAVLMRSSDDYQELIQASFKEHGIPFFVDRRRTAAHHPLLQFVRAALAAARNNYSHEPMMTLIKSGLMGLDANDADELENYVLLHGIRHGTWVSPGPWTGNRRITPEDSDDAAPALDLLAIEKFRRRVTDKLQPFVKSVAAAPANTVAEISRAIFNLLEICNVRETVVRWMNEAANQSRPEQQAEHERVWEELVKLFDELVDLLGTERVSLADFQAILDTGLESFDLALTPATIDQVLVGPVDRTRTPAIKACFVLGLNEGQFPQIARESSVFSDTDRRTLRDRDVDIEPDTQRRLLDEQLLGYIAFTRASDQLYLTRATADDDGKPCGPSTLWRRVREKFPEIPIHQAPRQEQLPADMIATPRQLITSLMRWVRSGATDKGSAWPAVYQWLATHEPCDDAVDVMRFRAWKALSYRNEAILSRKQARAMFTSPLRLHAAQLESFGNCSYQHFARHGLSLKAREEREVTGGDLSRVYHDVLETLLNELLKEGQDWTALDDAEIKIILDRLTTSIGQRLRSELMLSSARNRYLLNRIRATLESVVAAQRAAAQRGRFRAAFAGVRFGEGDGNLPPLQIRTPGGNEVLIRGKIDRVDVDPDSNEAAVIDYKLSGSRLAATSMFHGLSLQLLAHLLSLEQNGQTIAGKKLLPVAAFYVQLLRWVRDENPNEALSPDDPRFHLLVKPRGILDAGAVERFDSQLKTGTSDVLQVSVNKDGSFGRRESTDAAEPGELSGLLEFVREKIGQIADRILSGEIGIKPYRIGRDTPCPRCEFRDVCRFDPIHAPYVQLRGISRDELLGSFSEPGGEDAV